MRLPCDGGHGRRWRRRGICSRSIEGGLGERPGLAEAVVGRLVERSVERGRPSACLTAKPATARPTAFSTVLRPARAAMTCRPRARGGQRVAPVVPPAARKSCRPAPTDRGDGLSGVSAVTVPTAGAVR